jgi:hypothetical protein
MQSGAQPPYSPMLSIAPWSHCSGGVTTASAHLPGRGMQTCSSDRSTSAGSHCSPN